MFTYYRHPSSAAWIPAPSGCRLRRSPGIPGHGRAWPGIRGNRCHTTRGCWSGGPPFELLHRCWKLQKTNKNAPVASPDLVTFPLPGALASLEEYKNRTICSIFWSPCVFDNWTQNLSHVYSKKTRKRPKILQISNFLACSC